MIKFIINLIRHKFGMALQAPAADRNKEHIFRKLKRLIGDKKYNILEIASGTGQHVEYFAQRLPNCHFSPTDLEEHHLNSISKYVNGFSNVDQPLMVDVSKPVEEWPDQIRRRRFDLILCVNLIHISPWKCTEGLFTAASKLLSDPDGILVTYGPYAENGILEPESNVRFDQRLRLQNPEWGVRDIRDLRDVSKSNGLELVEKVALPANNHILVFKKIVKSENHNLLSSNVGGRKTNNQ